MTTRCARHRAALVVAVVACLAAVGVPSAAPSAAGAATTPSVRAIPSAEYEAGDTLLRVDPTGRTVRVLQLPWGGTCTGPVPTNMSDYGPTGLGPFRIAANGSFATDTSGPNAAALTVVRGRFAKTRVSGSVSIPAFRDEAKGFDCAAYKGQWKATRTPGTGDTTKPGATYADDDFSDSTSGFSTYNLAAAYAEYLPDARFRIGMRSPGLAASLRATPVTATVAVSVKSLTVAATGIDGAGLVCEGTGPTTFISGFVSQTGTAFISRYVRGIEVESPSATPIPKDLLKTGEGVRNDLGLICVPGSVEGTTSVTLTLNGTKVAQGTVRSLVPGTVGVIVNGASGTTQFVFDDFRAKKHR